MGNVDGGKAHLLLNAPQLHPHGFPKLRVQIGQRFIQEQNVRLHDQCPSHGHPLLLAAGHLIRVAILKTRKLHERQRLPHLFPNFRLGAMAHPQAIGHVLIDAHVGKEGVFLKYHGGIAGIGGNAFNLTSR